MYDCEQGNNQRYIDITRIHAALEAEAAGFSNALIGLHAFTGNDYTASFYHKAKKTPFNLLMNKKSSEWIQAFASMGRTGPVNHEVIESFVCAMYNPASRSEKNVNIIRRNKLFKLAGEPEKGKFPTINKVNCSMLPPCKKTLTQKIKRAHMVARLYGACRHFLSVNRHEPTRFWLEEAQRGVLYPSA